MIVDSMTDEEICLELKRDEAGVFAKMKAQLLMDQKNGHLKTFNSLPICYTREIISSNRNRFIALFYLDGKRNARGRISITNMQSYHLAVHYREGKGFFAYAWNAERPERLLKIVPHFFKRYAERAGVPGTPLDVIKHYLKKNRKIVGVLAVYKNKMYTAFVLETGIALGVMKDNVTTDLTFVSYDILFDSQKAWHDMMLKNLHDRLHLADQTLVGKERRKAWLKFVESTNMEDDVYADFWRLFARYHLKKNVVVTRADLPHLRMRGVFVLNDVIMGKNSDDSNQATDGIKE